jgi:hypothetical protein
MQSFRLCDCFSSCLEKAYVRFDIPHLERREEIKTYAISHLSFAMTYVITKMTYVMLI